jgi:RNA polymerase sigma factor (sigma-70 family)
MPIKAVRPALFRKADDERAFERLYERHVEGVFRYSLGMLGDTADAEDVTQTTFLNAYKAFKSGTRPEKPNAWLIAIAHNVCLQRFRQAQRRPREVAFDDRIGDAGTEERDGPTAEELRRALSELPPNQRAALVMRELEGCSYAEIAGVLGISVSALETLLFRARKALREQLDEQISCDEAAHAINRQLDGRLGMGERRALRAHLRACEECHSRAQSQRAQRRALKSLVIVPLPFTIAHWTGVKSASAATATGSAGGFTAVGATGGAAGVSTTVLGGAGIAAKVAAVVVAGVVVGGTYEGVTHATGGSSKPATRLSADAARQTPAVGVPVAAVTPLSRLVPASTKANANVVSALTRGAAANGASASAPGQDVKAVATTDPHALGPHAPRRKISDGHPQSPEDSQSDEGSKPAASTPSESVTHSQAASQSESAAHAQATTHAQSSTSSQAQSSAHTQSGTHNRAATQSQSAAHSQAPQHAQSRSQSHDAPATNPGQSSERHGNSSGKAGSGGQENARHSGTSAPHGNVSNQSGNEPSTTTPASTTTTTTPSQDNGNANGGARD